MSAIHRISVSQLARLVGTTHMPHIYDVRITEDIETYPFIIPSAQHYDFLTLADDISAGSDDMIVILCHGGLKLSQGVAALLRSRGYNAFYLQGGMVAWQEASQPVVPLSSLEMLPKVGPSLWVTRHRPKIDRIACPWFIRRFLDREARFLFVEPAQVMLVADRFGAIPFDVTGAALTHQGALCSFDACLAHFGLASEAGLSKMAPIIRAADRSKCDTVPEASGLHAMSVGLSHLIKDDNTLLETGMMLYDALYKWARDHYEEQHDSRALDSQIVSESE